MWFKYGLKAQKLLAQGVLLIAIIPRAMPWARSFCPFRAYGVISTVQTDIFLFYLLIVGTEMLIL